MSDNAEQPDTSMSPDVARLILCLATTLYAEGVAAAPNWMIFTDGPHELDEYTMVRKAADVVGRSRIKDRSLLRYLAEIDADAQSSEEGHG